MSLATSPDSANGAHRYDRVTPAQPPTAPDMAVDDAPQSSAGDATDISLTQKMLSATVGSLLTSALVTPLDVVRVRLQSQHHQAPKPRSRPMAPTPLHIANFSNLPTSIGISSCCREVFWVNNNTSYCVAGPTIAPTIPNPAACAHEEIRRRHFTGTLDGLRKIARHEGIRTLWRGMSPTLVMNIPANVIYFAGYDWLRTSPASPLHNVVSDVYAPLVAGSSARMLAAVAVSPIEMFRTRMQAAHHTSTPAGHFRETLEGLQDLVKAQGVRSLWRGLSLTLWRDVPFSAIYWWGYETGRGVLTDMRARREAIRDGTDFERGRPADSRTRRRSRSRAREENANTLVDSFIAGASSGAVAAFVTTPFDVGKTRQQVLHHASEPSARGGSAAGAAAARPEESNMVRFLTHIWREQGMSGLFKGWAARCLKVAPACAIMISTYEVGKKMAGTVNQKREGEK